MTRDQYTYIRSYALNRCNIVPYGRLYIDNVFCNFIFSMMAIAFSRKWTGLQGQLLFFYV